MKAPDYREATGRLLADPHFHMRMLADRLGVSLNTVNRARMGGRHARPAPKGWERALAELAAECAEASKQKAIADFRLARELSTGAGK
jgi:hypothetical protein